jgi:hypothetical protein
MAQKVTVVLVDDLDGGPADETVSFGLDGTAYEVDLSRANADRLRDLLAPYVAGGRRVGAARRPRTAAAPRRSGSSDAAAIREWAQRNGHPVSERGRISAEVRAAYERAH